MLMDKKIIIFGAGRNGEKVMNRLGKSNIAFFCDNYKAGINFMGKDVVDFSELMRRNQQHEYEIILSTNEDSIRMQMKRNGIPYWEAFGMENNFFIQEKWVNNQDKELLNRFLNLGNYEGSACGKKGNWFRETFVSDKNERLVAAMKNGEEQIVSSILSDIYDKNEGGGRRNCTRMNII